MILTELQRVHSRKFNGFLDHFRFQIFCYSPSHQLKNPLVKNSQSNEPKEKKLKILDGLVATQGQSIAHQQINFVFVKKDIKLLKFGLKLDHYF
jgi:hypothetical protein